MNLPDAVRKYNVAAMARIFGLMRREYCVPWTDFERDNWPEIRSLMKGDPSLSVDGACGLIAQYRDLEAEKASGL